MNNEVSFWEDVRVSVDWVFDLRPIQRSRCEKWGWRWHKWCHRSLFSRLSSTHWKGAQSTILLGVPFLSLTLLGWEGGGTGGGGTGGGISSFIREQRAQGQICLLGEVNWLGGKVVMGERKKSGGRGKEKRVRMVGYRSGDCSYRNPLCFYCTVMPNKTVACESSQEKQHTLDGKPNREGGSLRIWFSY